MTHDATPAMMRRTARVAAARRGSSAPAAASAADRLLARALLAALFLGLVALASLPAARAASATFGWVPLWLLLVPATAWLALRLRPGAEHGTTQVAVARTVRRTGPLRPARSLQGAAATPGPAMATPRRPRAARGAQVPKGSVPAVAVSRRGSTQPGRTKWQV